MLRMHAQHADIHKVRVVYSSYSCLAVARSTSLMFKVTVLRWTSPPRVSQVLTTLILRPRPEIATATHDCNPRLRPATAKNRDRDPHPPTAIVPCDRKSRPRRPNRDATRPRSATATATATATQLRPATEPRPRTATANRDREPRLRLRLRTATANRDRDPRLNRVHNLDCVAWCFAVWCVA